MSASTAAVSWRAASRSATRRRSWAAARRPQRRAAGQPHRRRPCAPARSAAPRCDGEAPVARCVASAVSDSVDGVVLSVMVMVLAARGGPRAATAARDRRGKTATLTARRRACLIRINACNILQCVDLLPALSAPFHHPLPMWSRLKRSAPAARAATGQPRARRRRRHLARRRAAGVTEFWPWANVREFGFRLLQRAFPIPGAATIWKAAGSSACPATAAA